MTKRQQMTKYLAECTARIWITAKDEDEAREKANEITNECKGIEFDYPNVEVE